MPDGKYIGSIDRSEGENSIELPESESKTPVLEIFVEAMGRINFAQQLIDMSNYKKGVVWVNGHNLGRYWEVGPQHSLYCPAPWLKHGLNEIIVFDLHQLEPKPIKGVKELK